MNIAIKGHEGQYLSSDVRFYNVEDVMKMTSWSEKTVLKLFADPEFPSADFGRTRVVEAHALIEYFSRKRTKKQETHWTKGDLKDELRKRLY